MENGMILTLSEIFEEYEETLRIRREKEKAGERDVEAKRRRASFSVVS